jgi:hypothetical protein
LTGRLDKVALLEMRALAFTTERGQQPVIAIPPDVAAQLPKTGHAWIVIRTAGDPADVQWRAGAYEQFMRDDDPEDGVYDDSR